MRGAWIEIVAARTSASFAASLPVRGAWIEIGTGTGSQISRGSRSPCGERGLKSAPVQDDTKAQFGRSPCGERGLKSVWSWLSLPVVVSLPVRGAWIEMEDRVSRGRAALVAPRAGSVD